MKSGLGRLCLATTAATAVFCILGCGKSDDKDAKKPGADGSAPEVVVDESRSALPDGLDVSRLPAPFEGTIRLERQAGPVIYEVTTRSHREGSGAKRYAPTRSSGRPAARWPGPAWLSTLSERKPFYTATGTTTGTS